MPLTAAAVTAVAVAVTAAVLISPNDPSVTVHDAADSGGPLTASHQAGTNWGTGYSGQYTTTNAGTPAVTGWTLGFTPPGPPAFP
jgi:Cellulose binding domain